MIEYDPILLDEDARRGQREALQAFWRRSARDARRSRWFWRVVWVLLGIGLLQTYLAWELIAVVVLTTPWTLLLASTVAWFMSRWL